MAPQRGQQKPTAGESEPSSDQGLWASTNSGDYTNVRYNGYYVPMYPAPPQPETSTNGFALNIGVKPYRPSFDFGGLLKGILDGTAGIIKASEFKKKMNLYERMLKTNTLLNGVD
uniref:Uncharacterized protein n=1 Tax=Romanomermis culicivorax TaxID=13658 RepID=A0A915KJB4_ROMCU